MTPDDLKARLAAFRAATANFEGGAVRAAITDLFAGDARLHLCHPFGDLSGGAALFDTCYAPLLTALPDLERRDMILLAGTTPEGEDWVAACGNYMGTFAVPFLDVPSTGHLVHMRYHEFFRLSGGRVTELQAIWDIPELMMQADAWPMAPQLGRFLCTPAPMSQDGLTVSGCGRSAMDRVVAMLADLCRHPVEGGTEVMRLDRHWHPRFNWYGPAGIGTGRGIAGFRNWHQIPFLRAMPDRKLDSMGNLMSHWLAESNYVCETGWPNMRMTITHDGWLGIPPLGKEITLRSLDFWRIEEGLIRENWVLVDLLDLYDQIGIDVFARMREFGKARATFDPGAGPVVA